MRSNDPLFTFDDVRRINDAMIAGRSFTDGLCPANAERVRRTQFSHAEIRAAFRTAIAGLRSSTVTGPTVDESCRDGA